MNHTQKNPFNITKAVDYSDVEINKYWVDFPDGKSALDIINPQSKMPIMILGGKGSGKTHLMRYFSYNLQKIRYAKNLEQKLIDEKYIGVFLRCGGLNAGKFNGNAQNENAWKNIFSYYTELWFAQLVINILLDLSKNIVFEQSVVVQEIKDLFDTKIETESPDLFSLSLYLKQLQKQVDYEVNNCAITGDNLSSLRILVSPGQLIFGIPKVVAKHVDILKDCQFLYLIDEYENLLEYQQRYINTLIREREDPVSFRIGARWYGVKTYLTFSGNEELKVDSEYEKIIIDKLFREAKAKYTEFAKKIVLKRLIEQNLISIADPENMEKGTVVDGYFESFDTNTFFNRINKKEISIAKSYLNKLKRNLEKEVSPDQIDVIVENIRHDNPLIERSNVLLFYRAYKRNKRNIVSDSKMIKEKADQYYKNQNDKSNDLYRVLDKYKNDIIDQLHRETREDLPYYGFDKIVNMSAGIPRLLLIMLKHIYRWAIYFEETPFKQKQITRKAQLKGIDDAISWFLDDARVITPHNIHIPTIIKRIGQLLQSLRFADLPPECSLSSFSVNSSETNEEITKALDYLEQYSYIIKATRREKNSSLQRDSYQIIGLLAPNWELSITKRGILELNKTDLNAIFMSDDDTAFKVYLDNKIAQYNFPFRESPNQDNQIALFSNE